MTTMEYDFIKVNRHDPDIHKIALKYKSLRLQALELSPGAFSSTLETESAFSDDVWVSRLQDPGKETFACVAIREDGSRDWVGQVTLRGPLSCQQFEAPEGSGQETPKSDHEEEKWQMLSLYTLPTHRGKRLGARLCEKTFEYLREGQGNGSPGVVVRIMVKPENTVTLRLYEGLGFKHAGRCTLEEALRANGDAELIPMGELGEKYTARSGIVMLLHLARQRQ